MGGCQLKERLSRVRGTNARCSPSSRSAQSSFPKGRAARGAAPSALLAAGECPLSFSLEASSSRSAFEPLQPNLRMEWSWRGGRLKGNGLILMAAAALRSLCAIR